MRANPVGWMIAAAALWLCACGGGGSTVPTPSSTASLTSCPQTFAQAPALVASATRSGALGLHPPASESEAVAPGVLAVRFSETQISSEAAAALGKLGARQISGLNQQNAASFSIPSSLDPHMAGLVLRGVRGVVAAGPVIYRRRLDLLPNDPQFATGAVQEGADFTDQWDLFAISMPSAWAVTTGSSTIKIAVIDTGYDLGNPDLAGKVDAAIVFDKSNGAIDCSSTVQDKDGHGTNVSGIAAADTNNSVDVAGVGWNVQLLEARVFPYGNAGASTQDIASAIDWAVNNGAKVINLSLGSSTPDNTYEEPAVAAAIAKGVTVVAAAGNDAKNTIDYPAADPGVIAVGASAYCDKATAASACGTAQNVLAGGHEYVASYSNYGTGLSLVAPGGDPSAAQLKCTITACIDFLQWVDNLDSLQGTFKEQVGLFAGTSQASPHVAGAVALMLSKDPSLTPAQALSIVMTSADNIGDPHEGAGRLNVLKALEATP